ncbi:MAG: hypothetical protein ACR2MO_09015 [Acidimicrobiales bacterium]
MTRRRPAVLAALALAAGGACSGSSGGPGPPTTLTAGTTAGGFTGPTVPAGAVATIETRLADEQRKRFPNLTVGAAACPDGAPEGNPGAAVTCTVALEGVAVPFTVTLLGAAAETAGGGDSYEFRSAKPILEVDSIVSDIRSQAATQLKVAPERLAVDCGTAKVHVLEVGGRIECTVNDGRTTRRLAAVVTDDLGSITINEVGAGP